MDEPVIPNQSEASEISCAEHSSQVDPNSSMPQPWQSLAPIAIIYFVASSIKQIASQFIYLLPLLAINYKSLQHHPYWVVAALSAVLALLSLAALLSYKTYRFRVSSTAIDIRFGIFSKNHVNLPLDRIQNVTLERTLYYRLSGHTCVQLDTAGSAKSEAKIIALETSAAEKLKNRILQQTKPRQFTETEQQSANQQQGTSGETQQVHSPEVFDLGAIQLNRRSLADIVIHGLTNNRIWLFLGGLAPFRDTLFKFIDNQTQKLGLDLSELFNTTHLSVAELVIHTLVVSLLIVLLILGLSVLGSIVSLYGYTLHRQGDKYTRRSGLFTKSEVSMPVRRLQILIRKQDWLDAFAKRVNLTYENSRALNDNPSSAQKNIVVPSITIQQAQKLMHDAYPSNQLSQLIASHSFTTIHSKFIAKYILLLGLPSSAMCFIGLLKFGWIWAAAVTMIAFAVICSLVVLRWKRWGVATDDEFIYVRKGLVGTNYYCFPAFKVQQALLLQSSLAKRQQIASVKLVLASSAVTIPLLNQENAEKLINFSLFKVVSSKKSWM